MARGMASVCAMAACAVLALMPAPGGAARADDGVDGHGPALVPGVQEAWKAGITGKGVRVGVIDTLPVSDVPAFKSADITYHAAYTARSNGKAEPCVVNGWAMPDSIKGGEIVHYMGGETYAVQTTHGTDMIANIVGDGSWWDGQTGALGVAPGASIDSWRHAVEGGGTLGELNLPTCGNAPVGDVPSVRIGPTITQARAAGDRIVSMSLGKNVLDDNWPDMVSALAHGMILVAARSNFASGGEIDRMVGMPDELYGVPGVVGVSNVGEDGKMLPDVADGNVAVVVPASHVATPVDSTKRDTQVDNGGTSSATSILSGYLALAVQKWPDATGNQILQSLVRTTREAQSSGQAAKGGVWMDDEHKRGFGQVDVKAFLDADPTQWPDINPILEMQMLNAADDPTYAKWYTQECPPPGSLDEGRLTWTDSTGQTRGVPCEVSLLKKEYERQKAAWEQVKQCKADGGSDCMRYSATATAPKDDAGAGVGGAGAGGQGGGAQSSPSGPAVVPVWVWWAGGAGAVVVLAGVGLAVVLSRRGRVARVGGRHGGHAAVPAAGGGPAPYGRQVPSPSAVPSPYASAPWPVPGQYPSVPQTMPGQGRHAPYPPSTGAMPYAYGQPAPGPVPMPGSPQRTSPAPVPPQPPQPYGQQPPGSYGDPPRGN